MRVPTGIYVMSSRAFLGLQDLNYPFYERDITVAHCGRICMNRKKISISHVLAGRKLGISEVGDGIWLVSSSPDRTDLNGAPHEMKLGTLM